MNSFEFNKSDYRLIISFFIVATIWLSFRYQVENYTNLEFITGLLGFVIKTASLLFILTWLIRRYIVNQRNYAIFFLLSFATLGFIGFLDLLRDYYTAEPAWIWNPSWRVILVNSFYNSTPDVALPLGLILGKKYYENKIDTIQLLNSQKELELKVLRSQYDPHFLYNSLNTIDALIDYSPKEKVKEYISHLAALYRYLIQTKDEDIVPLEDELALAKNYIYLIETRFNNDYNFKIIEIKTPETHHLPNGSLLTVLENVVKHNQHKDGKTVTTEISVEENKVRVTNTKINGLSKNGSLGTGLKNLDKRYRLLSDKKIKIDEAADTFSIHLPLLKVID